MGEWKTKKTHEQYVSEVYNLRGNEIDVLGTYINGRTPILHRCNISGTEWKIKPDHLLSGHCCKLCGMEKNRLRMEKIWTEQFDRIKTEFSCRGYDIIDTMFKGWHSNISYICRKHTDAIQTVSYGNFLKGHGCKYCAGRRDINIDVIRKEFEERNLMLLSTEYIDAKTKLDFICPKHPESIQSIEYSSFHSNGCGCKYCGYERLADFRRGDFETAKSWFDKAGLILVETEYVGNNVPMKYICPKHPDVVQQICLSNLQQGQGCAICRESKGEKKIRGYLRDNHIYFTPQQKFDGCISKRSLPFDVAVYADSNKSNLSFLIEFHGKQHYEPVEVYGGEKAFIENQKRDNIKVDYCKTNNIPLLVIPYWDFDDIECILEKELIERGLYVG